MDFMKDACSDDTELAMAVRVGSMLGTDASVTLTISATCKVEC